MRKYRKKKIEILLSLINIIYKIVNLKVELIQGANLIRHKLIGHKKQFE